MPKHVNKIHGCGNFLVGYGRPNVPTAKSRKMWIDHRSLHCKGIRMLQKQWHLNQLKTRIERRKELFYKEYKAPSHFYLSGAILDFGQGSGLIQARPRMERNKWEILVTVMWLVWQSEDLRPLNHMVIDKYLLKGRVKSPGSHGNKDLTKQANSP